MMYCYIYYIFIFSRAPETPQSSTCRLLAFVLRWNNIELSDDEEDVGRPRHQHVYFQPLLFPAMSDFGGNPKLIQNDILSNFWSRSSPVHERRRPFAAVDVLSSDLRS